jgi:hypothetical protein
MPNPLYFVPVRFDEADQLSQCSSIVAIIVSHVHIGMKPELGFRIAVAGVNVDGFTRGALVRIEEEPEAAMAEDYGHDEVPLWLMLLVG